ncbi:MAG: recombinase family protein, partial [Oscillospiraceae bacterium]|nr:recombinase family protein [Oscillospiraceae bacterium]
EGWGYKKIANYLTDEGIPTPRMSERQRKEAEGKDYKREVKAAWAIATVQGILENDFYIGTMRQSKYTRKKINGKDVKKDESEHIVIENHHQPSIGYREFATVKALLESRSTGHYRGQKKYDNVYSGFLECGDCGSPMFAMSRPDLKDAYRCGTYHRRGLKACTSHHIRVDKLDEMLKVYLQKVKDNSAAMIERLNADLAKEQSDIDETNRSEENLEEVLADLQEELKVTKRQRIRDIVKHPEQEAMLEETYDELEDDLTRRISGIRNQIDMTVDKRNTIIRVNRAAKTALEVFDDVLHKDKLDRNDLQLIIDRIKVYEDHVEIQLKADIDSLLRCGTLPEEQEDAANFKQGIMDNLQTQVVQRSEKRKDKVYDVNVVSGGDPLEIYTDKEGGVIFKKYSQISGIGDFAMQLCETVSKTTGFAAVITDRDSVIAAAGIPKREVMDRHVSPELENIMEQRGIYQYKDGMVKNPVCEEPDKYIAAVAAPILTQGDVLGCAVLVSDGGTATGETEYKLMQTVAGFLGRHMEA